MATAVLRSRSIPDVSVKQPTYSAGPPSVHVEHVYTSRTFYVWPAGQSEGHRGVVGRITRTKTRSCSGLTGYRWEHKS